MSKQPNRIRFEDFAINPETLFEAVAAQREPLLVEKGSLVFRVEIVDGGEVEDIWADYDPQQARAGLRKSAGALAGVDREQLLADIHAARQQNSHGRPA